MSCVQVATSHTMLDMDTHQNTNMQIKIQILIVIFLAKSPGNTQSRWSFHPRILRVIKSNPCSRGKWICSFSYPKSNSHRQSIATVKQWVNPGVNESISSGSSAVRGCLLGLRFSEIWTASWAQSKTSTLLSTGPSLEETSELRKQIKKWVPECVMISLYKTNCGKWHKGEA